MLLISGIKLLVSFSLHSAVLHLLQISTFLFQGFPGSKIVGSGQTMDLKWLTGLVTLVIKLLHKQELLRTNSAHIVRVFTILLSDCCMSHIPAYF